MNGDKKVISFEEYRRRRGKTTAAGPNEGALIGLFNRDLSEQKTLIEWYGFQEAINRYKFFFMSLFIDNHEVADGINPNAGFLIGFSDKQVENAAEAAEKELTALGRRHIVIDATGKSLTGLGEELSVIRHTTRRAAFGEFQKVLLETDTALVVKWMSRAKGPHRPGLVRSLIKILDDAHFKNIHPTSDLIFVDTAGFLQKGWEDIGAYIKIGIAK